MQERSVKVAAPEGLHARSAAEFCRIAGTFDATVTLRANDSQADASSILEILGLDVRGGDEVTLTADGPGAEAALDALADLLAETTHARVLVGVGASPGAGVAQAFLWRPTTPAMPTEPSAEDADREVSRVGAALARVEADLRRRADDAGGDAGAILRAQASMAADPALLATATELLRGTGIPAARAVVLAGDQFARALEASPNDYLRARSADIREVCDRAARELLGAPAAELRLPPHPVIVVAQDLTPADTAALDARLVRGLATESGSRASHTAILARSLGVPAVVGVAGLLAEVEDGATVGIDGDHGRVHVEPDDETRAELATRQTHRRQRLRELRQQLGDAATATRDGHRVEVAANVRSLDELQVALQAGAEAVGLLRTEFLYLDRDTAPTEAEQVDLLMRMGRLLDGRRLVVRTLDVGADKPLRFVPNRPEPNPELGVRGIRFAMRHPELLRTQLRAVARVADAGIRIAVMAPMVATLGEVQWFLEQLADVGADRSGIEVGVMVEVPSAVLLADEFAARLDFLSIGTNDLTQYLQAADRRSGDLAGLQDPFGPALLRAIEMTCQAGHRHGAWVGVCGEAASDPDWAVVAVGLGVDELSVQAANLLEVRAALVSTSLDECRDAARHALRREDDATTTPAGVDLRGAMS